MKHCIMCDQDRQNEEVSLVQVIPATWNGFHNFAEVCAECQGSRRFQVWARSITSSKKAAASPSRRNRPSGRGAAHERQPAGQRPSRWPIGRPGRCFTRFASHTLAGADLCGAALGGAALQHAALRGADLHRADLHLADTGGGRPPGRRSARVNLRGADLRGADLREARLHRADLNHSVYDAATRWPSGFDPLASGAGIVRRSG